MKITVQTSKIVKPAYGGHGCAPSAAATAAIVPLTVFDKVTFDEHISSMHFFRPPAPSNAALELGLARMLAEYRVWAGRRAAGRRAVELTDDGARFVAATADVALDSVVTPRELPAREVFSGLHPNGDGAEELMLVQVTRFKCGGFAVGTTVWHPVTDGRAARSFMKAWGQATRGAAICPLPVHDRVSFFRPRDPPLVEFEHRGSEFTSRRGGAGDKEKDAVVVGNDDKVVTHRVRFTREMIADLKAQALSSSSPVNTSSSARPYSTLQCVVAHLWRCITAARRLDAHTVTRARIAVNGRSRMRDPAVPEEYIGNVVLWAWPTTTAGELLSRPLGHAAELISRAVAAVDNSYFRSFIDFASSGAVEAEGLAPTADPARMVLCPDVQVDSLLGFPFQDLDFGGGPPFLYMPSHSMPAEGGMFLVPSFSGDGSVEAYVPLFSRNLETFKKCCYSSSLLGQLGGDIPLCRQPSALACSAMATAAAAADDDSGQRQRPMAAVRLHIVSPTGSPSSVAPQAWLGPSRSGHPRAGFGVPTATPSPPSASA